MSNIDIPHEELISQATSGKFSYRIKEASFGNGYQQRRPDGINSIVETYHIVWENLTTAQQQTIIIAINSTKGADYIVWMGKHFVADSFSIISKSGNVWDVTTNLTQVYDI